MIDQLEAKSVHLAAVFRKGDKAAYISMQLTARRLLRTKMVNSAFSSIPSGEYVIILGDQMDIPADRFGSLRGKHGCGSFNRIK